MIRQMLQRREAFAAVIGLTDGVLTVLTLAAGRMIQSRSGLPLSLAMRVAAASAVAGGVVFFTAEVARRNQELVHAEQQLNLVGHGQLATTHLGHFVLIESSKAALTVIGSNFLGALLPLLAGLLWRRLVWVPICFSVLLLGTLGAIIAKLTYRSTMLWTTGLMLAGVVLAILGIWLRIV
jgi:VIT1/CCC1 family predicted Fe2+/Mn2+ transporter